MGLGKKEGRHSQLVSESQTWGMWDPGRKMEDTHSCYLGVAFAGCATGLWGGGGGRGGTLAVGI